MSGRLKELLKRLKGVLRTKPLRYQVEGIAFLLDNDGRALLGDDMGVGKTLQVLGWLAIEEGARPAVIVCPSNAKYEWEDQMSTHTKYLRCEILSGRTPRELDADIVVVNYDILSYWHDALVAWKPKTLVMDECHYIKTRNIKRTKTCKKLSTIAKHVIPMSGTPIINRPVEFFPVLNMIRPGDFRSFWKYAFRYCAPKKGFQGRGWLFPGATNIAELHERVAPFMIRRMKSEVLKDLPAKRRIVLKIDVDNIKEYNEAKVNFSKWYKKHTDVKTAKRAEKAEQFVRLGQLRQLVARGKLSSAIAWIEDFLETTDEKLVVFSYHKATFAALAKKFKKVAAIGGKAGRERKMQVKRFQKHPKCRVYIGSIKADREAITLTASSTVLFVEIGWTPGEHDQAEDRVNRIGQTSSHITAYYLLGKGTIDEYVWEMIEKKRDVVSRVVNGEDYDYEAERRDNVRRFFTKIGEE